MLSILGLFGQISISISASVTRTSHIQTLWTVTEDLLYLRSTVLAEGSALQIWMLCLNHPMWVYNQVTSLSNKCGDKYLATLDVIMQ